LFNGDVVDSGDVVEVHGGSPWLVMIHRFINGVSIVRVGIIGHTVIHPMIDHMVVDIS